MSDQKHAPWVRADEFGADGYPGDDRAMAYAGLVVKPGYDIALDVVVEDFWFVLHRASGCTVLTVTGSEDQAFDIATDLARVRDWAAIVPGAWEADIGLAVIVAKLGGGLAQLASYDYDSEFDWDDVIPYADGAEIGRQDRTRAS